MNDISEPNQQGETSRAAPAFEKVVAVGNPSSRRMRIGLRLRTYFLAGLVVVGPVALTLYIVWWFIAAVDAWMKPLIPPIHVLDTYLPFTIPGIGLIFAIVLLTLIGALAANLLGRTLISSGEQFFNRMPIVRNLYRGLKQLFESMVVVATPGTGFAKVALIEFPSKGIWSLVYVTADATGEIEEVAPGGESDHVIVWMPTGFMPPTGFVSIVPRKDVIYLKMSVEDAAKIVISAGMVMPDYQEKFRELAEAAKAEAAHADAAHRGGV
jgi:uncharacterized membrane protein